MATIAIVGVFIILATGGALFASARIPGTGEWLWGGLAGLFGMIGLFVASRGAENPVAYYGGLAFFAFCVLFIGYQVKRACDHAYGGKH
jgi:hypothetical protein